MTSLTYNYFISSSFLFTHIIARVYYNKEFVIILHDILDVFLGISKIILFSLNIYNNIDFSLNNNNLIYDAIPNEAISNVLTYNNIDYTMSSIILLYDKNYEYLYHHIITILCLLLCQIYNYHNITLISLLLFMCSSPILSFAKLLRFYKYHRISEYTFILFAIVFFNCRIVYFTYLLYLSIFIQNNDNYKYYLINATELLIYKMQLDWMYKITKIIFNHYKK